MLSNDIAHFHDDLWLAKMGVAGVFEPLIDLSFVGCLKPQPEAFAHTLKEMGVGQEEVVFVDDQRHNVAGAEAYGLEAKWFDVTDPAGSVDRIRSAL